MDDVVETAPTSAREVARPAQRSFWSSAGIVFVGNVLARGLGFVFPLALAHLTSRADFALVYFFVATGFFVGELVLTGFPVAVTRHLAAEGGNPLHGRWLLAGMAGGIPLLAVSVIAGEILAGVAGAPPFLMSLVVVGLTIDAYYFASLRGLQSYGLLVSYRIAANVAQLLLLTAAAATGTLTVPLAVIIFGFSYLVPIALIELRFGPIRRLLRNRLDVTRQDLRELALFAVPALVSGTAYGAVLGADVFFVSLFAPAALADYGAGRALSLPMLMVPYAVSIVLLPRASASSAEERIGLLKGPLLVAAGLGAAAAGAYLVLGATAVALLLPESYEAATGPMRIIAPALAILGTYSVLSQWWFGQGRPRQPAVSLTFGAIVSVASHALVTSQHGAVGSGISVGAGAGSALLVLGVWTMRERLASKKERVS